jgi:hydrogenase expression/formation protein HypC
MCLAIPAKIIQIKEEKALVDIMGNKIEADISLLMQKVNIGDYVMVHAGFAIQKYDLQEAEENLKIIQSLAKKVTDGK